MNENINKNKLKIFFIKFSIKYIETYICPIFEYIISSKKKKFLIAGSQGIGKSTLLYILEKNLKIGYSIPYFFFNYYHQLLKRNLFLFMKEKL